MANWLAGICAFIAVIICYQLVLKHVTGTAGPGWFEAGCSDTAAPGAANCAAVLASPYSSIPPKYDGEPPGRLHVPVAFLGLVYYSALLIWLIGIGQPSYSKRRLHYLALIFVLLGLCGSAYFIFIMFRVINEWCPWCLVTHALNLVIAICALLMWPRRLRLNEPLYVESREPLWREASVAQSAGVATPSPTAAPVAASPSQGEGWGEGRDLGITAHTVRSPLWERAAIGPDAHPTGRLLALTLIGIVILNLSHMNMLAFKKARIEGELAVQSFANCMAKLQPFTQDTEKRFQDWETGKKYPIEVRADDPARMHATSDPSRDRAGVDSEIPTLDIVVFSDFECPQCGKFARFMEEQVQKLFAGHVREVFLHYPLDKSCNDRVGQTVHKHACGAVRMAEAARILKGNEGFWRAHDFLYAHQDDLKRGSLKAEDVAKEIGADASAFAAAMQAPEITQRLAKDIERAKQCEIRGTPAVFVEGRVVDALLAQEIAFWNRMADWYWKRANLPRPPETTLGAVTATPGNPSPKGVP